MRIAVALSQEDVRGAAGKQSFALGVEIYANGGKRITQTRAGKEMLATEFVRNREVLLEGTLPPSEQPYTLVVSTFKAGEERTFDLSIFTSEAVQVVPL